MDEIEDKKKRQILAIEMGTVIDHIPSIHTFKIMRMIDPQEFEHAITVALNLESKRMGTKGMIKISNRILSEEEVDKIAVLAPDATVNIIKDYKVIEKTIVKIPSMVEKIVKCTNPNCITNHEPMDTIFNVENIKPIRMRCEYCERSISEGEIKLI